MKIWSCKIGECDEADVPSGGDAPMRNAITEAQLAQAQQREGLRAQSRTEGWQMLGNALGDWTSVEGLIQIARQRAHPELKNSTYPSRNAAQHMRDLVNDLANVCEALYATPTPAPPSIEELVRVFYEAAYNRKADGPFPGKVMGAEIQQGIAAVLERLQLEHRDDLVHMGRWNGDSTGGSIVSASEIEWTPYKDHLHYG